MATLCRPGPGVVAQAAACAASMVPQRCTLWTVARDREARTSRSPSPPRTPPHHEAQHDALSDTLPKKSQTHASILRISACRWLGMLPVKLIKTGRTWTVTEGREAGRTACGTDSGYLASSPSSSCSTRDRWRGTAQGQPATPRPTGMRRRPAPQCPGRPQTGHNVARPTVSIRQHSQAHGPSKQGHGQAASSPRRDASRSATSSAAWLLAREAMASVDCAIKDGYVPLPGPETKY